MNEELKALLAGINKEFKEAPINLATDIDLSYDRVSTGSLTLDLATGGGWAMGGIHLIEGWESAGKTTLMYYAIIQIQKKYPDKYIAFIDLESAYNEDYARRLGVDTSKVLISQPSVLEDGFGIMNRLAKTKHISAMIVDSVASGLTRRELEAGLDKETIGIKPKLSGKFLSMINPDIRKNNIALFVVNQLRTDLQVMYGSKDTAPGGAAWRFFATIRVRLTRSTAQSKVEKDEFDDVIGFPVTANVIKNKVGNPMRVAEYLLRAGDEVGINTIDEVARIAENEGIIRKGGSWFSWVAEKIDTTTGEITEETIKIGQGLKSVISFLEDNPDKVQYIKDLVTASLKKRSNVVISNEDSFESFEQALVTGKLDEEEAVIENKLIKSKSPKKAKVVKEAEFD